jgi:hypothetical protein
MNLIEELEQTLSFFEPMNKEMIYIDLNADYVKDNNSITIEEVDNALDQLKKQKKIKIVKIDGHSYWQRIYPKKSLYKRLLNLFRK